MDDPTRIKLKQAYELVKLKDYVAARPLIFDVILKDKNNVDAWWLAAFVATKNDDKRIALETVLRLKPDHTAAQEMLQRLGKKRETDTLVNSAQLLPVKPVRQKRKIRWGVWSLRLIGFLCFAFAGTVILDNFLGGRILQPAERLFFGDPDASAWVNASRGGMSSASVAREERIPVTKEVKLKQIGDFNFDVIRQDEAHLYHFYASSSSDLMVMANFSSGGSTDIVAVELWDSQGRIIAHEERFNDILDQIDNPALREQLGSLLSVRAIQFTVPQSGSYTIAVISRRGGPGGNYTLVINTLEGIANQDLSEYTR